MGVEPENETCLSYYRTNYFILRVDCNSFALSIEIMSRELRKDPKPRQPFEQAEVRSQSQSAISPIKRPC